ncbi:hypothetical protein TYRP_000464 [Tyrophagus putrescentiae]|nr:hypothetical protein TYRP_000464 [Tyrophagus putrescentiae]
MGGPPGEHSKSSWSFQCSGRVDCAVEASSSIFGPDPCPMTSKYLEVHYRCISGAPPPSSESSGMQVWQ